MSRSVHRRCATSPARVRRAASIRPARRISSARATPASRAAAICAGGERADGDGDGEIAEVAVGVEVARPAAGDGGVVDIHGVGDEGGGGVGGGGIAGKHGDGVGDAERERAAVAAAGGDAAHGHGVGDGHLALGHGLFQRAHDADGERGAGREVQRDVAAVVDVGAGQRRGCGHGGEGSLGDGAGDRRHRRDELRTVGPAGLRHAAGDGPLQGWEIVPQRCAQQRQLGDQLGEQAVEAALGGAVGLATASVSPSAQMTRSMGPSERCSRLPGSIAVWWLGGGIACCAGFGLGVVWH